MRSRDLLPPRVSTGWFGIPGDDGSRSTKVHLVLNGKPVCGSVLAPEQEFQWCSRGIRLEYIECDRCRKWTRRRKAING